MREPVKIVRTEGSPYAGQSARVALAQLQADLGSATMAIEEARQSGEMTATELAHLAVSHRAIVRALKHMEKVRDAHGWPDPDADASEENHER